MPDQPSVVEGVLRRPFAEQVAYFRGKLGDLVPTQRWDDLEREAHDTAFMVAGRKRRTCWPTAAAVDRAITEGKSTDAFRKDFDAAVERHDWHGWTGEDTKAGRAACANDLQDQRGGQLCSGSSGAAEGRQLQILGLLPRRVGGPPARASGMERDRAAAGSSVLGDALSAVRLGCSCYVIGARTAAGIRRGR
ncbi:hypothetical protein JT366_08590 [Sphingomonas paucimobilis]|nr:hypothetical protein [Sphingomonas paucimobilis]QRY97260.1 hypothetical protein JT366_08590 [Sphingomonas paucimobilis]